MRTCLEKVSMDERHRELVKSDYTRDNEYSATHKDALADGDEKGKGTGNPGHGYWLPDCNGELNVINYSNFDTALSFNPGNATDRLTRETALNRSLYNGTTNVYSADIVDTSMNVAEGQFRTY